jgi:pilus assembly protein CpaE
MEKIRLYHIDSNEEGHALIQKLLGTQSNIRTIASSLDKNSSLDEIGRIYPDVVLIDENVAQGHLTEIIQKILLQSPYVGVIVTTTDQNKLKLRQFMNAGARDCLVKPFTSADLTKAITSVHHYMQILKNHIVQNSTKILTRSPKLITVFSTKGGVGKSTLAGLISSGLSSVFKEDTAIIDLDLQFGDISLLMDIKPKATITNITEMIESLGGRNIRELLAKHYMGVHILPSPLNPEEEAFITDASLMKIFTKLREEFDYVIVDSPPGFTDQAIVALEQSDLILFVTSPELISLKNTKSGLETMEEIGISKDKIKIIVNRFSVSKNNLSHAMIEELLNLPIYTTIANDYFNVIEFLNQGQPQLIFESNSPTGKDIKKLIESLRVYHQIEQTQKSKKWFWPFTKNK